jgi:elongation factor Ts
VARNSNFQSLIGRVAATALSSASLAPGVEGDAALAALSALPLPGGDTVGKPCTVAAGVTDMIAKVGENIVLRRGSKLAAPGGIVVGYTHNSVSPGAGTIGVLVALAPAAGAAAGAGAAPLSPAHPAYAALQDVGKKVAMHIAAAKPLYLSRAHVPADELAREMALAQSLSTDGDKAKDKSGKPKPAHIVAKMVEGRISKWASDVCLVDQVFVLAEDGTTKVGRLVEEAGKKAGLPVAIADFKVFSVGSAGGAGGGGA